MKKVSYTLLLFEKIELMLFVHGQQKERLYGGDIVFLQPPLKPGVVKMQTMQIPFQQPSITDEHGGQTGIVHFMVLGALGRQRLIIRIQENG